MTENARMTKAPRPAAPMPSRTGVIFRFSSANWKFSCAESGAAQASALARSAGPPRDSRRCAPAKRSPEVVLDGRLRCRALEEQVIRSGLELCDLLASAPVAHNADALAVARLSVAAERTLWDLRNPALCVLWHVDLLPVIGIRHGDCRACRQRRSVDRGAQAQPHCRDGQQQRSKRSHRHPVSTRVWAALGLTPADGTPGDGRSGQNAGVYTAWYKSPRVRPYSVQDT